MKYNILEYFTQAIDLIIIGFAGLIDANLHLILHELSRMAVAADIANSEVDALLDDHFIAAYICQAYLILILKRAGTMIFVLYGIYEYLIRLFRKGNKA